MNNTNTTTMAQDNFNMEENKDTIISVVVGVVVGEVVVGTTRWLGKKIFGGVASAKAKHDAKKAVSEVKETAKEVKEEVKEAVEEASK